MLDYNLDDIEYYICDIAILWRRALNQVLVDYGVSATERRILIAIARDKGTTQIKLAQQLDMEPQNISRALNKLSPYIKRVEGDDKRQKCIQLSAKGETLVNKLVAEYESLRPKILGELTQPKHSSTLKALQEIKLNLQQMLKD